MNIVVKSCHNQGTEIRDSLLKSPLLDKKLLHCKKNFRGMNAKLRDVKSYLVLGKMTVVQGLTIAIASSSKLTKADMP